ncbi:MAG: VIT domain-containing protein [Caulobacteraceae bacterium]
MGRSVFSWVRGALIILGLSLASVSLAASGVSPSSPELVARNVGGQNDSRALKLAKFDLNVEVVGGIARTTAEVRFENPTSRPLEGDFTFDLPSGSVVTGYGLDVGGRMIDGVIAPRRQAVLAYEARVRAGVDPGIAEVTRSNAFRTRIFPILPGQGRTVRLSFVTPIDAGAPYRLPLVTPEAIRQLLITVKTETEGPAPRLTPPSGLELTWDKVEGGYEARMQAQNVATAGALEIAPASGPAPVTLSRRPDGETFFEINSADVRPSVPLNAGPTAGGRLRLYWDTSRSRRDDRLADEIALVARYAAAVRAPIVDVITYAAGGPKRLSVAPEDLAATLKALTYGGASSMEGLFTAAAPAAAHCLLVSDGVVTLGPYGPASAGCRLDTLSSAPDADRGLLGALAARSGGHYADLTARDPDQALESLTSGGQGVAAVTDASGKALDYAVLDAGPGRVRIVGRAPASGDVAVTFGGGERRVFSLSRTKVAAHEGASVLFANARLAEMNATDRPDQDEVLAMARRYGVAAPGMAFIVLETANDYAQADIAPPEAFGESFIADYRRLISAKRAAEKQAQDDRLQTLIAAWNEQDQWWRTRFVTPGALPKVNAAGVGENGRPPNVAADGPPPPPPPPPPAPPPPPSTRPGDQGAATSESRERDEVGRANNIIVTGAVRGGNAQDAAAPATAQPSPEAATTDRDQQIRVELRPWNPSRPYLKALEEAGADGFGKVFAEQEAKYGDLPAFYLDVAEWLHRKGRTGEALAMVGNALELPTADSTTLTIVADRLARYGDYGHAIWLYEKILALEPERPQPRRDLATALIDRAEKGEPDAGRRADYQRALTLLNEVITRTWPTAYDGVEMVSLMEANRIIPRLKALGVESLPLDARLVKLLDVDLRVVLEWNTNITDMDLWVDEPTGERVIYNNPRSAIGGRLSNDMTEGYGPEEYLLRRAIPGTYKIRVNVYRADALNPNGAITIRVRTYRAWGRPDEKAETLEVEVKPDQSGAVLVGQVVIPASAGRAP